MRRLDRGKSGRGHPLNPQPGRPRYTETATRYEEWSAGVVLTHHFPIGLPSVQTYTTCAHTMGYDLNCVRSDEFIQVRGLRKKPPQIVGTRIGIFKIRHYPKFSTGVQLGWRPRSQILVTSLTLTSALALITIKFVRAGMFIGRGHSAPFGLGAARLRITSMCKVVAACAWISALALPLPPATA